MIIGEALRRVLNGLTLTTPKGENLTINFHYGDQKELNHWLYIRQKNQSLKYPLVWYVINDKTPMARDKYKVSSQLIIFVPSKFEWLNTTRANTSYYDIVEPVHALVENTLRRHANITILNASNGLTYKDEPKYGVEVSNESDFSSTNAKGTKSIATDLVDARILKIEMIIKPSCII